VYGWPGSPGAQVPKGEAVVRKRIAPLMLCGIADSQWCGLYDLLPYTLCSGAPAGWQVLFRPFRAYPSVWERVHVLRSTIWLPRILARRSLRPWQHDSSGPLGLWLWMCYVADGEGQRRRLRAWIHRVDGRVAIGRQHVSVVECSVTEKW
jgi:hypothetical protein